MNATINPVEARKRRGGQVLRPRDCLEIIESSGLHVVEGVEGIAAARAEVQAQSQPLAPAQVAHPLGPPTVQGTRITVDMMLNQVTRITRIWSAGRRSRRSRSGVARSSSPTRLATATTPPSSRS
jgi:hypothetical protein